MQIDLTLARRMIPAAVTLLGALCGSGCSRAADDIDAESKSLLAAPTANWPTNGGNLYNQRYSPLTRIDSTNIAGLKGVWRVHLDDSGAGLKYSGEAQPLVDDGVIYIITGADDVFALRVDDGARLWDYRSHLDDAITTVCCGWTSRGVGLGDGKVFVGQLDGKLVALDRNTGKVIWSIQAERWQDGYTITSAPLYFNGLVYTGFAGGERGIRGRIKAFDARDGKLVWTFNTIPGPGEFGHDTWPQDNDAWMDGAAPIWQTPAVDPELGLLYFSTGNAGPDYNGSTRAGDNLFAASIVALDLKTGAYRWHFQEVHHDIWDYDAPNPVILFDLEINGTLRKGLAQAGKTGWVYILDRATGAPLIGIEEKPVPQDPRQATAATQPYPVGDAFIPQSLQIAPEGYRLINQGRIFTPFWTDEAVVAKPGVAGGANWPPSAYDPARGHMFVCAADRGWAYRSVAISGERPPDIIEYIAGNMGGFPQHSYGVLAALDMRTNKLVWQQHWAEPCFSGVLATGSGLLFVGRNDGRLTALDSADGRKLWEFQTGAGMNSPVTSFEHNGQQYVVAYSAGNLLGGGAHGDSVWLFGLNGTLPPAPAPAAAVLPGPRALATAAPAPVAPAAAAGDPDLENGKATFATACVACHGEDGMGGHGGGVTLANSNDVSAVVQIIREGRKDMPAMGAAMSPEQLRDVAAYVSGVLASGAPAN